MTLNEINKVKKIAELTLNELTTGEKLALDWEGVPSPEHQIVTDICTMLKYDASNDEIEEIVESLESLAEIEAFIDTNYLIEIKHNDRIVALDFRLVVPRHEIEKYLSGEKRAIWSVNNRSNTKLLHVDEGDFVDYYDSETGEILMILESMSIID